MAKRDQNGMQLTNGLGKGRLSSRFTATLLIFLGVAAVLLIFEHRAHVFSSNGILVGLLGLCVIMHLFLHGGHGGHTKHEIRPPHDDIEGQRRP